MTLQLIETIKKARAGHQSSMHDLYNRFLPQVRSLAFDRTGDYAAACEIVQEVFMTMVQGIKDLKEPEQFRAWLLGIARHKAADFVKGRAKARERFQGIDHEIIDDTKKPPPEEVLKGLHDAVKELPEEERLAVQLFHLESMPVREIVEIIGLPRSTIYARLIKARVKIRNHLEKLGYSEDLS